MGRTKNFFIIFLSIMIACCLMRRVTWRSRGTLQNSTLVYPKKVFKKKIRRIRGRSRWIPLTTGRRSKQDIYNKSANKRNNYISDNVPGSIHQQQEIEGQIRRRKTQEHFPTRMVK